MRQVQRVGAMPPWRALTGSFGRFCRPKPRGYARREVVAPRRSYGSVIHCVVPISPFGAIFHECKGWVAWRSSQAPRHCPSRTKPDKFARRAGNPPAATGAVTDPQCARRARSDRHRAGRPHPGSATRKRQPPPLPKRFGIASSQNGRKLHRGRARWREAGAAVISRPGAAKRKTTGSSKFRRPLAALSGVKTRAERHRMREIEDK